MTMLFVLLCQSTGLLALGLLALHLTRGRGPTVQTLVGRATLTSVALLALLLPLSGYVAPVVRVTPGQEPTPQQVAALPVREGEELPPVGAPLAAPSAITPLDSPAPAAISTPAAISKPADTAPAPAAPKTPRPHALHWQTRRAGGPLQSRLLRSKEVGSLWLAVTSALLLWLAVTSALLLWLGVCQWHLTRLRRTASAVTPCPATALLASRAPSPPRLLTHSSVHSPFLAGYRRPAIFLPEAFETQFEADALRAIFVHELAHRDRRDNLWTLAARFLCALLWPQPLLWLLVRQLEHLSEDACDEAVLSHHCSPRAYADCLLSLATRPPLALPQRTVSAGVAPFRSSVGRRIQRILSAKGDRPMPVITPRLRLAAAAVTIAAALGSAFLVSSAPAQTTAPAPSLLTPQEQQYQAEKTQDLENLKIISLALVQYTQDHDEFYPDAAHWMDELSPYIKDKTVFFDPFQPNAQRYGYAFNRNCSGKTIAAFAEPAEVVSIFDSTLGTQNASDTGQSLALRPIQRIGESSSTAYSGYSFADGHVRWKPQTNQLLFAIKWDKRFIKMTPAYPDAGLPKVLHNPPHIMSNPGANYNQALSALRSIFTAASAQPDPKLSQAQLLASLTPVQGPGVVVTLRDSKKPFSVPIPAGLALPNIIHDSDINEVVNELRAAGAEAIAVNNQRLVTTSAVRCAGPTVYVNNMPQAAPFVIQAIGGPKALYGAITLPGGVASQLKEYDPAMFTVQQAATLTLPAYTGGSEPRYARPVPASAAEVAEPVRQKLLFLQKTLGVQGNAFQAQQHSLMRYDQRLEAAVHQALPQASPATLVQALNLERLIGGWTVDYPNAENYGAFAKSKGNRVGEAQAEQWMARDQTDLRRERVEEVQLFPRTPGSRSLLRQIHKIAIQESVLGRDMASEAGTEMYRAELRQEQGAGLGPAAMPKVRQQFFKQ